MFEPGMVQTLVEGVRDTLYMVLASTAFGYLLGLPLGILLCITGENGIRRNPVIYRILDIVVNLIRSVPFLILLILALAIIGLLPAVVPTQAARVGSEKKVHEKLEALYESYGLSLDASSLPASQTLYSIELENPDAKPAAQALLGGKAAEEEAPARMLAQYSAGSSTLQLSRSGQLEGRFTDASAAHDLARATRRYLRSMSRCGCPRASTASRRCRASAARRCLKVRSRLPIATAPFRAWTGRITPRARSSACRRERASPARTRWWRCCPAATASAGSEARLSRASRAMSTPRPHRVRCALCRSGGLRPTQAHSMSMASRAKCVSLRRSVSEHVKTNFLKVS